MKAKSMFFIKATTIKTISPSIQEVAKYATNMLFQLGKVDEIFLHPIYYHSNKRIPITITQNNIEDISMLFAQQILNKEWDEITRFEGNKKPTIDYRRPNDGFSLWAEFQHNNERRFEVSIGVGYQTNGITISSFNRNYEYEYDWYENVFWFLVKYLNPIYCTVKLTNQIVNGIYNKFNFPYPPGWITFYSRELSEAFPRDILGLKYQNHSDGLFIKMAENDFLADKDSYEEYKNKLEGILIDLPQLGAGST